MRLLQLPGQNVIVVDTQQRVKGGEMLQQWCLMPKAPSTLHCIHPYIDTVRRRTSGIR